MYGWTSSHEVLPSLPCTYVWTIPNLSLSQTLHSSACVAFYPLSYRPQTGWCEDKSSVEYWHTTVLIRRWFWICLCFTTTWFIILLLPFKYRLVPCRVSVWTIELFLVYQCVLAKWCVWGLQEICFHPHNSLCHEVFSSWNTDCWVDIWA